MNFVFSSSSSSSSLGERKETAGASDSISG